MIEIKKGSLEERVLNILLKKYPITVEDLRSELGVSKRSIERVVKAFITRGIITIDVLPDKEYIRVQRRDFRFIGRHESQRRPLKHIKRRDRATKFKPKKKNDDYNDMMYQ
jgi:transcriptional antiterminator